MIIFGSSFYIKLKHKRWLCDKYCLCISGGRLVLCNTVCLSSSHVSDRLRFHGKWNSAYLDAMLWQLERIIRNGRKNKGFCLTNETCGTAKRIFMAITEIIVEGIFFCIWLRIPNGLNVWQKQSVTQSEIWNDIRTHPFDQVAFVYVANGIRCVRKSTKHT